MSLVPPCEQPCSKCGSTMTRCVYVAHDRPDAEYLDCQCCSCNYTWQQRTAQEAEREQNMRAQEREDFWKWLAASNDPVMDTQKIALFHYMRDHHKNTPFAPYE